jgi:hypothetical protein
MILHVASLRFRKDASGEAIESYLAGMRSLSNRVPGIRESSSGFNLSPHAGEFTHGTYFLAESLEVIAGFRGTPLHVEINRGLPEILEASTVMELDI